MALDQSTLLLFQKNKLNTEKSIKFKRISDIDDMLIDLKDVKKFFYGASKFEQYDSKKEREEFLIMRKFEEAKTVEKITIGLDYIEV
jgi:predicted AlkP superfamily phosphohydrolase/phosphomutase